jgi:hypothetical protein
MTGAHRLETRRPPHRLIALEGNHLTPAHQRAGREWLCPTALDFGTRTIVDHRRAIEEELPLNWDTCPTALDVDDERAIKILPPIGAAFVSSFLRSSALKGAGLPFSIPPPPWLARGRAATPYCIG